MINMVFIGAGSIAEALIQGWTANNIIAAKSIYVTNRNNKARLEELQQNYQINILHSLEELQSMDIVVLAMKPKDAKTAMNHIAPYIKEDAIIFSVLAGIGMNIIENYLGKRPIIRAMPNTSATIGLSATGIAFNDAVSKEHKTLFWQLLEAIGVVVEVSEDQLHAITALSGSGPAYIYYFLEAFEQIGLEYGLPSEVIRKLMVQTIVGSAEMIRQVKEEPHILRKKVTSPGGTTEAAIKTFEEHHFIEALMEGVRNAEKRSRQLAKEL